jgi:hypothetical protein
MTLLRWPIGAITGSTRIPGLGGERPATGLTPGVKTAAQTGKGGSGGEGSGGGGPIQPPGKPPNRWRPGRRYAQEIKFFSQQAERTRSPHFRTALLSLKSAHDAICDFQPFERITSHLRATTSALHAVTTEEMKAILPKERNAVSLAIVVAGELTLMSGKDGECVVDLFKAAADFSRYIDRNFESQSGEDLFRQDIDLSHVRMNLMASLQENQLPTKNRLIAEQQESIAALLCRIGMLRGSVIWPSLGVELPNVAGAVYVFFQGLDLKTVQKTKMMAPSSYFGAAFEWRTKPLGLIELILANLLPDSEEDGDTINRAWELSENITVRKCNDPLLQKMNELLFEARQLKVERRQVFEQLVDLTSPALFGTQGRHLTLPAFLKKALSRTRV